MASTFHFRRSNSRFILILCISLVYLVSSIFTVNQSNIQPLIDTGSSFEESGATTNQPDIELEEQTITNVTVNPTNGSLTIEKCCLTTPGPSPSSSSPVPGPEADIPRNYNKLLLPYYVEDNGTNRPVEVEAFVNLLSVRELNELKGEITVEMKLSVLWRDGVLYRSINASGDVPNSKAFTTVNPDFLKRLWNPDIYLSDLTSAEQPMFLNSKQHGLDYNRNHALLFYNKLITVSVHCNLEFHYYPADTQNCFFSLQSYFHENTKLRLGWITPPGVYLDENSEDNFDVAVTSVSKEEVFVRLFHVRTTTPVDALRFVITCRRKLSYHVVQTFVPSVFFMLITTVSYLIPKSMVEARIGITMTTLLTLTAMFSSIRESGPTVSYVKAIDIWMIICIMFVFLVLLECSIICWLNRRNRCKDEETTSTNTNPAIVENGNEVEVTQPGKPAKTKRHCTIEAFVGIIEKCAFRITSSIMVLFLTIFWTWLLIFSKYFEFTVNPTYNNVDGS